MQSLLEILKKVGVILGFIFGGFLLFIFKKPQKIDPIKKQVDVLEKKEAVIKTEIIEIEKKIENISKNGVEDLSPEQEIEYWKKNGK